MFQSELCKKKQFVSLDFSYISHCYIISQVEASSLYTCRTNLPDTRKLANQLNRHFLVKMPDDSATQQSQQEKQELPEFTVANVARDVLLGIHNFFFNSNVNRFVVPILVPLASIIAKLVITNVKYTEIDFSTYMQQIELVNAGARDYSIISGDTGPIVYPAGFVQVYQLLYWLTDGGVHLRIAQTAFGYLFAITVMLTSTVYTMVDGIPPWTLYLLLGSRRLISIYVLRMFNDCFTTLAMISVVLLLQQASYWSSKLSDYHIALLCGVAADVYSMAILVKMNALLYLPAFILVVYFLLGERLLRLLGVLLVIPIVQVVIGWNFLLPLFWDDEARRLRWAYLSNAFDFSRKFLYKWSVNWKFVPEETFLSDEFGYALLAGHLVVLLFFTFTRYLSPALTGKPVQQLISDAFKPATKTVSKDNLLFDQKNGPRLILLIFATTNLIGVIFARSLHYQFLSWYCWLLPFLLYSSGSNVFLSVGMFFFHEWCWNVFPATKQSSQVLVMILASTLVGVWGNQRAWVKQEVEEDE